jgi:hypothetical protein
VKNKSVSGKRVRRSQPLLERVKPDAAGIDCGAATHYVAVPPDRDPEPVRRFKTCVRIPSWPGVLGDSNVLRPEIRL